jgi:protein SCO1/2
MGNTIESDHNPTARSGAVRFLHSRLLIWMGTYCVALILVAAAVFAFYQSRDRLQRSAAAIGGPFELVDQRGKTVTSRDYLGKPTLVFFGYTFCPDVCPTTLLDLTNLMKQLGPDADRLNVLFITVDPERDTPQQLALYLSSFDPRINGLSGTNDKIAVAMKAYHVFAEKVPSADGGYTMDHTAIIYMMNSKGQFAGVMNYREPDSVARAKLRRLLDSAG